MLRKFLLGNKEIGIVLFVIVVVVLILVIESNNSLNDKEKKEYLESLDFRFSGIVTEKKELYSFTGLIYVNISQSTIAEYDRKSKKGYYYCILKGGKAEIIETMDVADVGDSITVDGYHQMLIVYRKRKKIKEKKIWLSDYDQFYADIKKYHRF